MIIGDHGTQGGHAPLLIEKPTPGQVWRPAAAGVERGARGWREGAGWPCFQFLFINYIGFLDMTHSFMFIAPFGEGV